MEDRNYLGYVNSWYNGIPEQLKKCRELGHKIEEKTIGRCLTECSCSICNFYYKIDSGD